MLESLFIKVAGLQAMCFHVNIAKSLRSSILKYTCKRLLLYFRNPNYKQCNLHTSQKLHFQFWIYKIFSYLLDFVDFSSTEFVFAFAFFLHTISNISHISNISFSSSLNRFNAFSHCQKFVLIGNAQDLSSGFI